MNTFERDYKRAIDMIFVKRLESRLGRELTEFELEDSGEAVAFYFPDGHIEEIVIPRFAFPHDAMPPFGIMTEGNRRVSKRASQHDLETEELEELPGYDLVTSVSQINQNKLDLEKDRAS